MKKLRICCGITLLVLGIAVMVIMVIGSIAAESSLHPDYGLIWAGFFFLIGLVLASIGFLTLVIPYLFRLANYIFKRIKVKRSTPT